MFGHGLARPVEARHDRSFLEPEGPGQVPIRDLAVQSEDGGLRGASSAAGNGRLRTASRWLLSTASEGASGTGPDGAAAACSWNLRMTAFFF